MKTINLTLDDDCFRRKADLPSGYTWARVVSLGLDAARREEEKKLYWRLQQDVAAKNPGTKLGLVRVS